MAKASFNSTRRISSRLSPARDSALRTAGTGPKPMVRGGTPAAAEATTRARGFRPRAAARSALIKSSAAAPSFRPEELPAVTVPPSLRKAGLRRASDSTVVSRRGRSSVVTSSGSPFFCGTGTGTISSANLPESMAAMARRWLSAAKASCWLRSISGISAAMFSAVSPIESVPYNSCILGLG